VETLGKRYVLQRQAKEQYQKFSDTLLHAAKAPLHWMNSGSRSQPQASGEDFWALKDINFEVKRGAVLGIIGRNGAGKSTLLKVLSRILEPTSGRITLKGRIASLLKVSTGFHPELSGRENIFLNGAILGMRRDEIKAKFAEIVAFAVVAHLEPEILIIDEVLAVGDAAFQVKCLGTMGSVAADGRTVVMVSHNAAAVRRLCSSAMLLEGGRMVRHLCSAPRDKGANFVLISITLQQRAGRAPSHFAPGDDMPVAARLDLGAHRFEHLDVSFYITDLQNERVTHARAQTRRRSHCRSLVASTCTCFIQSLCLAAGDSWIGVGVSSNGSALDKINQALRFRMGKPFIARPGLLQVAACRQVTTPLASEG
jgi:ABC-type polysaccharide/polyol phosphate transport system ATPase subunit